MFVCVCLCLCMDVHVCVCVFVHGRALNPFYEVVIKWRRVCPYYYHHSL